MAPYGKIKADAIIWDNSGTDTEESLSSIGQKATTTGDTFTGDLLIDNAKELRLGEPDASGTNYTGLKAQAQSGDITLTLPAVAPTANQVLKADASTPTTLTWASDVALTLVDEDDFASNSATAVPSQQSTKAYIAATSQPLDTDLTVLSGCNSGVASAIAVLTETEVEILDGATVTTDQLNRVDATSSIQTQLDTKMSSAGGQFTGDIEFTTGGGIKWDTDSGNTYNITLKAPNTLTASAAYVFPSADGSSGQALTTNGSGQFAWTTVGSGDATKAGTNVWTGVNSNAPEDTPAATGDITIDFGASNNFKVTLTGNAVFKNPSTEVVGASGSIFIKQDSTGSRTASWESQFHWKGGTSGVPTLSTAAGAVDRVDYICYEAGSIHCVATLDIKAGA